MLQIKNNSPFKAHLTVLPDKAGVDTLIVTVKGTFLLGGEKVVVHPKQIPVAQADVPHGDPAKTSIKTLGEVSLPKPATDLVMFGHAYAPGGSATQVDVTLRIGTGAKVIRVFGDRTWTAGLLGSKPTPPQPFAKIPLIWERAFGGLDINPKNPEQMKGEDRNPVGKGFHHFTAPPEGTPLPNLEDPNSPYRGWRDRPEPKCFAPIGPGWLPRRGFAGTYDKVWLENRSPFLPDDFDPRFLQAAPPDQVLHSLTGGEPIEILNATPGGRLAFNLPAYDVEAVVRIDQATETPAMKLDTVILQPDDTTAIVVWRAAVSCDKKALKVREVEIRANPRS
jgi:hypothetical protein